MASLYEIIKQFCPDGVVFSSLSELGTFYGGLTGKSKDDFKDGNAKFITYMNVYSNPALRLDVTDTVKVLPGERQNCVQYGDVLFTGSSETPDECGMSSVLTQRTDEKLYLNSFCMGYRLNNPSLFEPDFLKHLFRSAELRKQISRTANGVTRFNVSKEKMRKVKIPVPPLEVQREIVRILDNFTELTAELTARKQQYEYYRDSLLSFSSETVVKKIGEITRVFSASRVHKDQWTEDGVPFFRSSDVIAAFNGESNSRGKAYISKSLYDELSKKTGRFEKDDVLVTGGGTIGIPYIIPSDDPIYVKDADLLCIKKNDQVKSRFLYHYFLSTKFRDYLRNITHDATIAHYTISQIENTPIPVPPIAVQERLVNVLDNFDTICSDLKIGLPAEIDARKKQYEYYRDLLLTFMESGATILTDRQAEIALLQYVFGFAPIPLRDVANVFRGNYITKKESASGDIPVILGGQEPAYFIDKPNHEGEVVVVARSGASAGFVSYWNEPIYITDGFGFEAKPEIAIPRYLYYVLKNKETDLNAMKRGAGVPHVSGEMLGEVILLFPSLHEQKRIVSLLDQFDTLVNSISEGVPAEIEARRKQYEYYRDKLLSFKTNN